MQATMQAAFLPGNSTVELRTLEVRRHSMESSPPSESINDLRFRYSLHIPRASREGPEGYQGVIAGHEPCGQIVEAGRVAGASGLETG